MPEIKRLSPFFQKVLNIEACGKDVVSVMVVTPTIVKPGNAFDATVSLLDGNKMPSFEGTQAFSIRVGGNEVEIPAFSKNEPATCLVKDLTLESEGFVRLEANYDGNTFYGNPTLVTADDRSLILWGDPHIHTTVGDCHAERCRTRNLAYTAARYVYGLDFVAIADHVSWAPRGTKGKWLDNLAACALYDEPGAFSTLYCYETSLRGGHGGDNNVYMREPHEDYVDPWPDGLHVGQLCEEIKGDFFVVPHHTTRTGKHGEIPAEIYPGPELMPVLEIHSKWGCSEYRGNPNPLHDIHEGPAYAQELLAQGYRLGFIGGTDSHSSLTFSQACESETHDRLPGLTAVSVQGNSREEIYDAIKARNCYAASGERIYLDTTIVKNEDGSRQISATAAAQSEIVCIDVVCNGKTVHSIAPESWNVALSWSDKRPLKEIALTSPNVSEPFTYYYVRITTTTESQAWSSPVWF